MRTRMCGLLALLVLATGGFITLSLTRGQDGTPQPSAPPLPPSQPDSPKLPDLSRLPAAQQERYKQVLLDTQRGAEWLFRMNGVDGRFAYGQIPALNRPLEGDHYLHQIGAAFALARAARCTGAAPYAARATQAIVRFFDDTVADPQNPQLRYAADATLAINRVAAAGLLVLAVHELPAPQTDLLDRAEELCNFLRSRQQADGSFRLAEAPSDKNLEDDAESSAYPGAALYALVRSQVQRPAAWKMEAVARALPYYQARWRAHKSPAMVPWQAAAYTEAFLQTHKREFADFVFEMTDHVCTLQLDRFDPRHADWWGGFRASAESAATAPQASSAAMAETLVCACRVARELGDVTRYDRYKPALELGLQFVLRLQYTAANTGHFKPGYRDFYLLGGFHASPEDGTLRIDYTQHAVSALVQYLAYVAAV